MFDIESKKPDEITITTKKTSVTFNVAQGTVDAGLKVGKIAGPGEFEIGDVSIRAIGVSGGRPASSDATRQTELPRSVRNASVSNSRFVVPSADGISTEAPIELPEESPVSFNPNGAKVIYDVEIGGVHVGIIGGCEEGLDELGMIGVLCTSSVRAVREIEPRMVVAMGNVDGMVTDLKLSARTEKKLKIKNADSLPLALEVVVLN
ncbi:hypothetical protein IJN73_00350 [Candidatus Saccharibacteria bacterium]|nr:hypothetical protein [Candidatus Saccharibacteria bacterium]